MTNAELFAFLFAHPNSEAEEILTRWSLASRRFHAFLVEYKVKIRKKLRLAQTPQALQSLLLELDIARQLVDNPRCRVEYEKYGQGKQRNPDLTVTFHTHTCLQLEVTRVQMVQEEAEGRSEKLIRVVCAKLGQLVPQTLNCLVVATESRILAEEIDAAMKSLKRRVEQRDGELLSRMGFNAPSEFFKQFQWLNGIVLCTASEEERDSQPIIWTNSQSRSSVPSDIRVALQRLVA